MIQIAIFIGGAITGLAVYKLYDYLSHNNTNKVDSQNWQKTSVEHYQRKADYVNSDEGSVFNLSVLKPIMSEFGVDINNKDCLYLLLRKIEKVTYEKLLLRFLNETSNPEEMISLLNNLNIGNYQISNYNQFPGGPYMKSNRITQLMEQYNISIDNYASDSYRVETLINVAYSKSIETLKSEFGDLFAKLIDAYENQKDASPYYDDIIKNIKIYRDFLS